MMADNPSSYLVLASQRSGSTLLVESLRATGVAGEPQEFFQYLPATSQAPQPREWFSGADDESILAALSAGAAGYLTKDASAEETEAAIRAVHRGQTWLAPTVQARLVSALGDGGPDEPPRPAPGLE